jgi:hypothetical protein
LHQILQSKGLALGYDEDIKLSGAFSRLASSGIDAKIRATWLNIVAALSQVLVDHIAKLKALFQRRSRLEERSEVQAVFAGEHPDTAAVQEVGGLNQGEGQPLSFGATEVALLIEIREGLRTQTNLIAHKPGDYFFGHVRQERQARASGKKRS